MITCICRDKGFSSKTWTVLALFRCSWAKPRSLRVNSNNLEVEELTLEFSCFTQAEDKASWHTQLEQILLFRILTQAPGEEVEGLLDLLLPPPPGHVLTISRWFQRLSSKEALTGISAHSTQQLPVLTPVLSFTAFKESVFKAFLPFPCLGNRSFPGKCRAGFYTHTGVSPLCNQIPWSCTLVQIFGSHRLWNRIKLFS